MHINNQIGFPIFLYIYIYFSIFSYSSSERRRNPPFLL